MSVYIIGEAGSCHEDTPDYALELVRLAAEAGCDAVKFQYWSSPLRMRERRRIADSSAYAHGSVHLDWLPRLRVSAKAYGIDLISSVFLPEDVSAVAEHCDAIKVASFEAGDRDLLRAVAITGRPVYVSTGMMRPEDVGPIAEILPRATLLHCVSAYPCPPEQASLGAIVPGGGYSDHTRHVLTGACAAAAGATTIEVHFRLAATSQHCPDYVVALSPEELCSYVSLARLAHTMRGDGIKRPQRAEEPMMAYRVVAP